MKTKIAYLGLPGSYSYVAAKFFFPRAKFFQSCHSIENVFAHVALGNCQYGLVPIENSTTGSIQETYDEFLNSEVFMRGEIILQIHHHLLGQKEASLSELKKCYSHPQAFFQCSSFFQNHPKIKKGFAADTASAVKFAASRQNQTVGAIGGKLAAKIYNLKILKENIEDSPHNYTRFAVIAKDKNECGDKVSLIFSLEHKPGSLVKSLQPYALLGFNLTKIESRPIWNRPWEYIFFVDFEIGGKVKELKILFQEMKEHVNFLKILGIYDRGKIYET